MLLSSADEIAGALFLPPSESTAKWLVEGTKEWLDGAGQDAAAAAGRGAEGVDAIRSEKQQLNLLIVRGQSMGPLGVELSHANQGN